MSDVPAHAGDLPARYEPLRRLGAGGSGEVWSVRDRVNGSVLALKVLSAEAGEAEIAALVREAVALSGLEGLGVPRIIAFGALRDGRRYMVRELTGQAFCMAMSNPQTSSSARAGAGRWSTSASPRRGVREGPQPKGSPLGTRRRNCSKANR
jgi:hypothetical protein